MEHETRSNSGKLVAFVLPDLRIGGVERITIALAEEFLRRGYRVDLVLGCKRGELLRSAPGAARVVALGESKFRRMVLPLRRYVKAERPAALRVAIWSLTVIGILAVLGLRSKPRIVVSDHSRLTQQYASRRAMMLELRASIFATYRLADGIVGVSDGISSMIAKLAGLPRKQVTTIYNPSPKPVSSGVEPSTLWGAGEGKRILAVGQLKLQKNHALLIKAFAKLQSQREAKLAIVGEGDQRAVLEALVDELNLNGKVLLPGFSTAVGDWYESADLFVLSSDYEGFGNVLVEALHFGLPVVSTDCPSGPREILGDDDWGRLVPPSDPDALAQAMASLLNEPVDVARQRRRAADFSLERAADAYEALMLGKIDTYSQAK